MDLVALSRVAGSLLGSRTIWGGVILLANSVFAHQIPPEVAGEAAGAMTALFSAIGATLIVIGRIGAKPLGPS